MNQDAVGTFLLEYKNLAAALDSATTTPELIRVIPRSGGMKTLPRIIFDSGGRLKSFTELQIIANRQLRFLIKNHTPDSTITFLLLLNLKQSNRALEHWHFSEAVIDPGDGQWFQTKYGISPDSPDEIRRAFLQANLDDLRWYLDIDGRPRKDSLMILAQARQQLSLPPP